jgi:hypothetical protein
VLFGVDNGFSNVVGAGERPVCLETPTLPRAGQQSQSEGVRLPRLGCIQVHHSWWIGGRETVSHELPGEQQNASTDLG